MGVLLKLNKASLEEFGGTIKSGLRVFCVKWGFTKQRANSKSKMVPDNSKSNSYWTLICCVDGRDPSRFGG